MEAMEAKRARRSKMLQVRLTPGEYEALEVRALADGTTVAEFVRRQLRPTLAPAVKVLPTVEQVA